MSHSAGEQWAIVLEALPDTVPAASRMRTLLKIAGRRLHLRCIRVSEEGEIARLRKIIDGLARRVAAQAELLARRAERRNTG